jgi:putative transcriptional regulator
MSQSHYLNNHCLIATRIIAENTFFDQTVIYIKEHSSLGAVGFIINRPLLNIEIKGALPKLLMPMDMREEALILFAGGPNSLEQSTVLYCPHSAEEKTNLPCSPLLSYSDQALFHFDLSTHDFLIVAGYTLWKPGELEMELQNNLWLTTPFSKKMVFADSITSRRQHALSSLGFDPRHLRTEQGHA